MAKFEYTLADGSTYTVLGPPGATQLDADRIFYEQVAAGSLVGYVPGQTLTSEATQIVKFGLSRLDRGTAGVDTNAVLAIAGNYSVSAIPPDLAVGVINEIRQSTGITTVPEYPNLSDVELTDPITQSDVAGVVQDASGLPGTFSPREIGPISAGQVQGLLAQIANLVNQPYDQISFEKGIGKYGFTALQLEAAGYVKPGTVLRFLAINPEDFVSVMSTPGVWTGLDGVSNLESLLTNPDRQSAIQTKLMTNAYQGLQYSGAVRTATTALANLSQGQIFYQGIFQPAGALTTLVGSLGIRLGTDGRLTVGNSLANLAPSFGSINAGALSSSVVSSLTGSPALGGLAGRALNSLTDGASLGSLANGAVSTLSQGLNNLTNINFSNISLGVTNQLTGEIGALVTNAAKWGSSVATNWANGTLGNLTNIGTNLSSLASSLDISGKMSQFASSITNPLGSIASLGNLNLNNLDLSNLANLGNLGNLANLGNLGNLAGINVAGLISGNLGSLFGGLGSLGSIGGMFGGGGGLVSSTQFAGGFTNTVNRSTLNAATTRVLGNAKIPSPQFEFPSLQSILSGLSINQAQINLGQISRGVIPSSAPSLISGGGFGGGLTNTVGRLIG